MPRMGSLRRVLLGYCRPDVDEAISARDMQIALLRHEVAGKADTTVVVDGKIIAKPTDLDDARRMIAMLAGRAAGRIPGRRRTVVDERPIDRLSHRRCDRNLRHGHARAFTRGSAIALGENIRSQQNQSAGFVFRQRIPNAGSMAAHEVVLQLPELIVADMDVGELAESRSDAIDGTILLDDRIHNETRVCHLRYGVWMYRDAAVAHRDVHDVVERQAFAVDFERVHRKDSITGMRRIIAECEDASAALWVMSIE